MPIEVPDVARLGPSSAELPGKVSAELQAPVSDAFMGDHDAPLGQDQLHIPQAQAEYMVQPYSVADDLGRKAIAGIGGEVGRHPASLARPYRFGQRASTWQCPRSAWPRAAPSASTEAAKRDSLPPDEDEKATHRLLAREAPRIRRQRRI